MRECCFCLHISCKWMNRRRLSRQQSLRQCHMSLEMLVLCCSSCSEVLVLHEDQDKKIPFSQVYSICTSLEKRTYTMLWRYSLSQKCQKKAIECDNICSDSLTEHFCETVQSKTLKKLRASFIQCSFRLTWDSHTRLWHWFYSLVSRKCTRRSFRVKGSHTQQWKCKPRDAREQVSHFCPDVTMMRDLTFCSFQFNPLPNSSRAKLPIAISVPKSALFPKKCNVASTMLKSSCCKSLSRFSELCNCIKLSSRPHFAGK